MRSVSDYIASTGHHGEPKPAGPIAVTIFVMALLASIAGAAWFIGMALADKPIVSAEASLGFE